MIDNTAWMGWFRTQSDGSPTIEIDVAISRSFRCGALMQAFLQANARAGFLRTLRGGWPVIFN
jgi:hypothetical protein